MIINVKGNNYVFTYAKHFWSKCDPITSNGFIKFVKARTTIFVNDQMY